jgi:hypothetical protein
VDLETNAPLGQPFFPDTYLPLPSDVLTAGDRSLTIGFTQDKEGEGNYLITGTDALPS